MRILIRKCLLFVFAACIIFTMSGCGSIETDLQSDSQGAEDPGYTDGNASGRYYIDSNYGR